MNTDFMQEIFNHTDMKNSDWLLWKGGIFMSVPIKPLYRQNRETLARLYKACTVLLEEKGFTFVQASRIVRSVWIEEVDPKRPRSLPRILGEDGFLRMYALGVPCTVGLFRRIWNRLGEPPEVKTRELEPIYVEWNEPTAQFYDVDATPKGFLSKFFPYFRLKKDKLLLAQIANDLKEVSYFQDSNKRMWLSMAILSHGAAYRELEGHSVLVPSFTEPNKLIPYLCTQHLIAEGLKTVSLVPLNKNAVPIYLCQGTEFWPSQPSMLSSILANLGEHGSATEAYAHSWRRIHKHLRELPGRPIVAGHSMGGALAIQIGLYSHHLIERSYAFNPPVQHERDYAFYHQLSEESKDKICVIANLDDFAFWRIGSKVIGNVTLFLGKIRWKYYSIGLWDCILFLPAFVKFFRNVHHAFPAHQSIVALYESWISVRLTQEEIDRENRERISRFDYLHFLPKLYDPMRALLYNIRKVIRWSFAEQYLRNEIEILALHEQDLLDTLSEENRDEIEHVLSILKAQKDTLIQRLPKR